MKILAVIPARFESTRFPGKPLCLIKGKPMIWWVYNQVKKATCIDSVIVATDDLRIKKECEKLNIEVIMTSKDHKTGTDRVAEVSRLIEADLYVNVQGDEPLIEATNIDIAVQAFEKEFDVINLKAKIDNPVDAINPTIPKVITNREGLGMFLTRSLAPFPKGNIDYAYYKQVCVYVFTKKSLEFFSSSERGMIEEIEDIEILRFIENNLKVKYIEVETESIAVDTEKDLLKVIEYVEKNNLCV